MNLQVVRIDSIKWWVTKQGANARLPVPLCPDHNLRMKPVPIRLYRHGRFVESTEETHELLCAEGSHNFNIPRKFNEEREYVINRIDAKVFAGMKVLNLDDEAIPIVKESAKSKSGKYFLTAQLMESKRGIQVVVYAGEKGRAGKTQIFIEPEIKRLAFDQKDLNPTEVFTELKATFDDGSSHIMKRVNNGS